VKLLRTLSTARLAILVVAVAALVGVVAAIAVASGGGGPTPPPKPLAQAIHDGLAASKPEGVTARITFTNRLFPSGALLGNVGSALMSGASGRLWLTNDGNGRLELQSNAGDVQVVWDATKISVYDASSNTVYKAALPGDTKDASPAHDTNGPPALSEISDFLAKLGEHATISGAQPSDVAGHAAYRVSISPKHDGGLLGSAELAWDAARGVPLDVAIFAQGSSSPVLELKVTHISYGPVSTSDVAISPPAGTKTVDLGSRAKEAGQSNGAGKAVTGLAAAQAAAGFTVVAPDKLVGLPRQDVRAIGPTDSKAVLVVYGQSLGAIAVVERKADSAAPQSGPLSSLPKISLDGVTGHELATQLGTVLQWQRNGVAYVLAGSLPPAAAETAARDLK
jgi:outer membrane lipoprotein-sorting protein